MTPRQLRKICQLKPEATSILKAAMEELGLSARAHDKVLRVARTIADLEAFRRDQAPAHRRGGGVSVARPERVDVGLVQQGQMTPPWNLLYAKRATTFHLG